MRLLAVSLSVRTQLCVGRTVVPKACGGLIVKAMYVCTEYVCKILDCPHLGKTDAPTKLKFLRSSIWGIEANLQATDNIVACTYAGSPMVMIAGRFTE